MELFSAVSLHIVVANVTKRYKQHDLFLNVLFFDDEASNKQVSTSLGHPVLVGVAKNFVIPHFPTPLSRPDKQLQRDTTRRGR